MRNWRLYKDLDVVADIKKKRLEWIGHAIRMEQVRTVKKISENKLERSGRRGGFGEGSAGDEG
jgi:hypothetical protein